MSTFPSDVPQRNAGEEGTDVPGARFAADREIPEGPQGPGAGVPVQPVLGSAGDTYAAALAADEIFRNGLRKTPID